MDYRIPMRADGGGGGRRKEGRGELHCVNPPQTGNIYK